MCILISILFRLMKNHLYKCCIQHYLNCQLSKLCILQDRIDIYKSQLLVCKDINLRGSQEQLKCMMCLRNLIKILFHMRNNLKSRYRKMILICIVNNFKGIYLRICFQYRDCNNNRIHQVLMVIMNNFQMSSSLYIRQHSLLAKQYHFGIHKLKLKVDNLSNPMFCWWDTRININLNCTPGYCRRKNFLLKYIQSHMMCINLTRFLCKSHS